MEFSRDGLRLLQASSIDNQVCLWDARTGRKIWEVPGAYRAVFDPTGDRVIASRHLIGRSDLVVLDAADGHLIRKVCDLKAYDTALAVSPDGQFAVTGDSDAYLRAISIEGGQFRYENRIRNHQIQYVAFSADRSQLVSVASGSGRQAIGVWDAQTGVFLHSLVGDAVRHLTLGLLPALAGGRS